MEQCTKCFLMSAKFFLLKLACVFILLFVNSVDDGYLSNKIVSKIYFFAELKIKVQIDNFNVIFLSWSSLFLWCSKFQREDLSAMSNSAKTIWIFEIFSFITLKSMLDTYIFLISRVFLIYLSVFIVILYVFCYLVYFWFQWW